MISHKEWKRVSMKGWDERNARGRKGGTSTTPSFPLADDNCGHYFLSEFRFSLFDCCHYHVSDTYEVSIRMKESEKSRRSEGSRKDMTDNRL